MAATVNPLAARGVNAPSTSLRPEAAPADAPRAARAARHVDPAELGKLRKAAAEFESVFVKQILQSAKITGKMGDGGYGGMALDALAGGVTKQGGIGLARAIEESVLRQTAHDRVGPKKEAP